MIRHCVMFRWADGTSDDTVAAVTAGLDALAELDAVHDYRHGADLGLADGNYDYVVVGDFATVDDYRTYAADEGHQQLIADLIKPNIVARTAVQYEV